MFFFGCTKWTTRQKENIQKSHALSFRHGRYYTRYMYIKLPYIFNNIPVICISETQNVLLYFAFLPYLIRSNIISRNPEILVTCFLTLEDNLKFVRVRESDLGLLSSDNCPSLTYYIYLFLLL